MNNLIEIMHKIHCGIDARLEGKSADVVLAEETKKIAIEFANYCNSSGDCSELFDKFIEEYYE